LLSPLYDKLSSYVAAVTGRTEVINSASPTPVPSAVSEMVPTVYVGLPNPVPCIVKVTVPVGVGDAGLGDPLTDLATSTSATKVWPIVNVRLTPSVATPPSSKRS
jgi:hypothetical protein